MFYKVSSYSGWFIVDAKTKRSAYSEGVKDYGRGNVKEVVRASKADVRYFIAQKGHDAIEKV